MHLMFRSLEKEWANIQLEITGVRRLGRISENFGKYLVTFTKCIENLKS